VLFRSLLPAAGALRRQGACLALDDFGDGRSSLRLWSELKPEIVKIDKYFAHDLPRHPEKLQTLRALLQISQTLGAALVVEGIETAEELHLVRDLGVTMGQGWFLGCPAAEPVAQLPAAARAVIDSNQVAVFPERRRPAQQRATAVNLLEEVAPVLAGCCNDELFERFAADDALRAVAIVDATQRPIGLVSRQHFIDQYARPFFKELHGRKPCTSVANLHPRLVEMHYGIDELAAVLMSHDQRYLSEGFIVTENGRYRGMGSAEQLVRAVTETRIEAARHANPLTLLPGNIPLTQHIQRLLAGERVFAACYCDLDHFKPFNDQYGYWRGDEMILTVARVLSDEAVPTRDFVGHVGGDDFVVLFQSPDWRERCTRIRERFDALAAALYDDEDRAAGGIAAEDRHGVMRFHPLTRLSIGAVLVDTRFTDQAEDVASAAALAKRRAKQSGSGFHELARVQSSGA
jgi:diguanylate cyclase (GGDEF)-like protein